MKKTVDIWNEMVRIRDNSRDPKVKNIAHILLGQMNTAAGMGLMRTEAENFIAKHKKN